MDSLIRSIIKYIEYYNEERIINKFHMSPVMYKQNYWKNKNNGVKYRKSYRPMVKIIGEGSTPRELATFQSFPEDFIFVEVRNGSLLK